jgi:hypothetical protein
MSPTGPPDKYFASDLSSYTTAATRVAQINTLVSEFFSTYGVYPIVILDSVVNAAYLGAYDS